MAANNNLSASGTVPVRSSREDVLQFLDDLDSFTPPPPPAASGSTTSAPLVAPSSSETAATSSDAAAKGPEEAQSVLDFLEEITQRSATPVPPAAAAPRTSLDHQSSRSSLRGTSRTETPPPRASSPAVVLTHTPPTSRNDKAAVASTSQPQQQQQSGWGWSSVWSTASTAIQQARVVAEENLAKTNLAQQLPQGDQAKKWTEGVIGMVKGVDVDKLRHDLAATGMKTFTDLINAVAPPIAEHEIIEVWLSHDMVGYEGVETLVYRALSKVMEQVEGGDLVVNNGSPDRPANADVGDAERDLHTVDGFTEGHKLASANLDDLVKRSPSTSSAEATSEKSHGRTDSTSTNPALPITICPVYMRIQPVLAPFPHKPVSDNIKDKQLYFFLILRDPANRLECETMSQAMPAEWLDIPFEDNEWMENEMVDVIRKSVEIVGQDYVRTRQTGRQAAAADAHAQAQAAQAAADAPAQPAPAAQ